VRTFRPLSDGNRIRVTMHRIRTLLGQDRIVLRDSAYALGGPPFRVATSSSGPPSVQAEARPASAEETRQP
jgi:hypothetical protein